MSEFDTDPDSSTPQETTVGEILLLSGAVISLLLSCILWSPHKQAVDGRDIHVERGQRSFALAPVLRHPTWRRRRHAALLHDCVALGKGLRHRCSDTSFVFLHRDVRGVGGYLENDTPLLWNVGDGIWRVCVFWGTSGLISSIRMWRRVSTDCTSCRSRLRLTSMSTGQCNRRQIAGLLVWSFLSQAALVFTHVLGIIYGGLILLALIVFDAAKAAPSSSKLYLLYAAGWLVLLVWVPAIRASMAAGKPHGWIMMPTFTDLSGLPTFSRLPAMASAFSAALP